MARRRVRKGSVSTRPGPPFCFCSSGNSEHMANGNHKHSTVASGSMDYGFSDLASLYTYLAWRLTISRITSSSIAEDTTDSRDFFQLALAGKWLVSACTKSEYHPPQDNAYVEPQVALNILQLGFTVALHSDCQLYHGCLHSHTFSSITPVGMLDKHPSLRTCQVST